MTGRLDHLPDRRTIVDRRLRAEQVAAALTPREALDTLYRLKALAREG